jgi:hypothetical protein
MDISALGLTAEDLKNQIIEKAVEKLLAAYVADYDDEGEPITLAVSVQNQIDATIKKRTDEEIARIVGKIGEETIAPKVESLIENMMFQKSNGWGEPKGEAKTWREMLIERADTFLSEQVNINGKTQAEDSYSWRAHSTRLVHMVKGMIQFEIEREAKSAFGDMNSKIAGGVLGAVRIALNDILANLKVTATTK